MMRPKFRLQAPNVKKIESPFCRRIVLAVVTSEPA